MTEETYSLEDAVAASGRFVVITGCSGGGKSTMLAALAAQGHSTVPEPGRQIVKEQHFIGGSALPWVDLSAFAELCVSRAMNQLALAARHPGRSFFDRGIVDAVTALERLGRTVPPHLSAAAERLRYHQLVFVAPPRPELFSTDTERRHDFDAAVAEYESLGPAYRRRGYVPVELPRVGVEERVDFVLKRLDADL
ncbi:AAA family ATPase [Consotaella aegiceratis]|uniref:AAA family ATPase n=1 Tax=Consotaella aegiceratis TaxID=3097961 RepID=UPI002F3F3673